MAAATLDVEKPLLSESWVQSEEKAPEPEATQPPQYPGAAQPPQHPVAEPQYPAVESRREHNWAQKFQKLDRFAMKIATPISRKASGFGCQSFVPQAVDRECQKAAQIVKNFSYDTRRLPPANTPEAASQQPTTSTPPHIVTIPPRVLAEAVGLIIFTTGRLGLGHFSGSTGSGVLITRRDDGTWGTPIPIQAYSAGGGLVAIGAEVTDRVYVFNNRASLELFKTARFELGPEVVLAAGPYGGGGGITFSGASSNGTGTAQDGAEQVPSRRDGQDEGSFQGLRRSLGQPVYCYMRSRGLYAGLQVEGTVFVQNHDKNVPESASAVLVNALRQAEGSTL